jgi:hypothetical protein
VLRLIAGTDAEAGLRAAGKVTIDHFDHFTAWELRSAADRGRGWLAGCMAAYLVLDLLCLGGLAAAAAADWSENITPAQTQVRGQGWTYGCFIYRPFHRWFSMNRAAERPRIKAADQVVDDPICFLEPPPPVFYSARTALEEASKAELCPVGFWGPNCTNCPGLRLEFSNVSAAERVVTIYDAAGASSSVQLDGTKACSNHGVCVNSGTLADKYADGTDVNPEDRCACDRGYEGDACDRAAADEPAAFLPLIVVVMGFFAFGLMVCVLRLWEACRVRSSGHFRVGEADVFAVAVALYCAMRAGSTAGDAHGANSGTDDHSAVNTDAMLVHAATSPHRP